jgi:hypothetical protein
MRTARHVAQAWVRINIIDHHELAILIIIGGKILNYEHDHEGFENRYRVYIRGPLNSMRKYPNLICELVQHGYRKRYFLTFSGGRTTEASPHRSCQFECTIGSQIFGHPLHNHLRADAPRSFPQLERSQLQRQGPWYCFISGHLNSLQCNHHCRSNFSRWEVSCNRG